MPALVTRKSPAVFTLVTSASSLRSRRRLREKPSHYLPPDWAQYAAAPSSDRGAERGSATSANAEDRLVPWQQSDVVALEAFTIIAGNLDTRMRYQPRRT